MIAGMDDRLMPTREAVRHNFNEQMKKKREEAVRAGLPLLLLNARFIETSREFHLLMAECVDVRQTPAETVEAGCNVLANMISGLVKNHCEEQDREKLFVFLMDKIGYAASCFLKMDGDSVKVPVVHTA